VRADAAGALSLFIGIDVNDGGAAVGAFTLCPSCRSG